MSKFPKRIEIGEKQIEIYNPSGIDLITLLIQRDRIFDKKGDDILLNPKEWKEYAEALLDTQFIKIVDSNGMRQLTSLDFSRSEDAKHLEDFIFKVTDILTEAKNNEDSKIVEKKSTSETKITKPQIKVVKKEQSF